VGNDKRIMSVVVVPDRSGDLLHMWYLHTGTVNTEFTEGTLRGSDKAISSKSSINFTQQIRKGEFWFKTGFGFSGCDRTTDVNGKNTLFFHYFSPFKFSLYTIFKPDRSILV
jgi:hypothetical protein